MKNILVAIDFNDQVDRLVNKARKLARALKSKVWLLHIAAPDPDFVGMGVGPQFIRDQRADELKDEHLYLQEYTKELIKEGIDSESLLVSGPTIETIVEESKKLGIDLIIAGHHHHGFIYNAIIGSVSTEIINKSNIPVMIVPLD